MADTYGFSAACPALFGAPQCAVDSLTAGMIGVVGMPTDWTHTSRIGTRMGAHALRRASSELMVTLFANDAAQYVDPQTGAMVRPKPRMVDCGNAAVFPHSAERTTQAIAACTQAVREKGATPLALGGDHYNSYPACLGYSRALAATDPQRTFGYIQIDGHLDFSDRLGAWGRLNHATNARRISELPNIVRQNMIWIGITGWVDAEEIGLIEQMGGKVFSSHDIHALGAEEVARRALAHATRGCASLYFSLDIDATDAAFLPGTGSIVQSGVTPLQLCAMMDVFSASFIDGMDIVEVAPNMDASGRSERIAAWYLMKLLQRYIF